LIYFMQVCDIKCVVFWDLVSPLGPTLDVRRYRFLPVYV